MYRVLQKWHSKLCKLIFSGNLTTARREGTLAFSPESPLTRTLTKKAIETVVLDNVNGFLALLFDVSMLPEPKGYASASDMEMALKEPNVMNHVLCGIQFEDSMASKYFV